MTNEKVTRASEKLLSKLSEVHARLEQHLEAPYEALDLLVTLVSKGEEPTETWELLHHAAQRDGKIQELAFAYENIAADKRIRLLTSDQQAYIYLWAVHFFGGQFSDPEGALAYGQRALAVDPAHQSTFEALEYFLANSPSIEKLAPLYLKAAQHEAEPSRRLGLLLRASELVASRPPDDELARNVYEMLLVADPRDFGAREALAARYLQVRQPHEAARLFEQALEVTPPLDDSDQRDIRERLIDMYQSTLGQPERALPHVEGLLAEDPNHATALAVAESLLEHRTVGLRATAALSDAHEAAGRTELAIQMLNIELSRVRGPRRVEVGRRLAIFRQDVLGDPAGALELLGPVVAGDPGNDAMRHRFVALSLGLDQTQQAARLLSRALTTTRDPAVRARVGVDVGEVFLRTGDTQRAQAAFEQVLEANQDPEALLKAARRLQDLTQESADPHRRAQVLALLVKHEPEKERRQAAARRLAKLCETELSDPELAITAYRALLGSPWSDDALQKLEALYEEHQSPEGMAEVLDFRAERTKDPEEARALAFRAAELRSEHSTEHAATLATWRALIDKHGESRNAYDHMIALLEKLEDYEGLAQALEARAKLEAPAEAALTLARLGKLRMEYLGDARAALSAFRQALGADPENRDSRSALEQLVMVSGLELDAAQVLEPLYRAEGNAAGLVQMLLARAQASPEAGVRLAAFSEAVTLAETELGDTSLALNLAGQALVLAASEQPALTNGWLARVQAYAAETRDHARLTEILETALGDQRVDSAERLALARATGEALAETGRIETAVAVFRRALEYDRSAELVERVDQLLVQQGTPRERLELYESALQTESDPAQRVSLLRSIAELRQRQLGDYPGAITAWRAVLSENPKDRAATLALVDALRENGELEAAYTELEQLLANAEGEDREEILAKLGELATRAGALDRALSHYQDLLTAPVISADLLARIEEIAEQLGAGEVIQNVLGRRIAAAESVEERQQLLDRAGSNALERLGDRDQAARLWTEAAEIAERETSDTASAIRLYERVLSLNPDSLKTAERLLALYAAAGQWQKLSVPFLIVRKVAAPFQVGELLVGLEEQAVSAGQIAVFLELIDSALGEALFGAEESRRLALVKARVLSAAPDRYEEAAVQYKNVIESAGDDATEELDAFEAFLLRGPTSEAGREHRRWLYELRAQRTGDPVAVLMLWALAEEREFGDLDRAARLYERVLTHSKDHTEALTELSRLKALQGDAEGALMSLEALRDRSEGDAKASVELSIAKLLMDPLGRPTEALRAAADYMEKAPADPEALSLARRALDFPESRAEAARYLENAADASSDPKERAAVLEALLSISEDSEELRPARGRWIKGLLAIKSEDPEGSLTVALRAAEADPSDDELWAVAERFARRLNRPEPVAIAYSRVIARDLPPELAQSLGRRVVEFQEEWFEDNDRVIELLRRVLELSPGATWAFDRLKLQFNAQAQWADLFALYDSALEHLSDDTARIELLREVSMAAKDFAGDADKAIGYLEQLHRQCPSDERVEASLERLYERNQRYRPLIALLEARLAGAVEGGDLALRERIARLWMQLDEPLQALEQIQLILERGEAARVIDLLEALLVLPASRESMTPAGPDEQAQRARRRKQRLVSVRERASQYLRSYYQEIGSTQDVVRMLEVAVETAQDDEQRVRRLKQIIKVRLNELEDSAGAFDNVCQLVTLVPEEAQFRKLLHQLAQRLSSHERQATLLVSVADQARAPELKIALLAEAAAVHKNELGDDASSIALYLRVLEVSEAEPDKALAAARELDPMLERAGRFEERCSVLERLAELEPELQARRAAQGEAARVAFHRLGDAKRAIANYSRCLTEDPEDLEAMDGLVLAYSKAEAWDRLVETLNARSRLQADPLLQRADLVSVARVHTDMRADVTAAIDTWRKVYDLAPDDGEAFDALVSLLTHEERWQELAELLDERAEREEEPERRAALHRQLGEVHRGKTHDLKAALDAFVKARDWERAMEVAGSRDPEQTDTHAVPRSLLDQAVSAWLSAPDHEERAANAAQFAIGELGRRLLDAGEYAQVVDLLLKGADLPFEDAYSRELRQKAAFLCADQVGDTPQAIAIFKALFTEDPSDAVAAGSVQRLAELFEAAEAHDDLVALWEQQATCCEAEAQPERAAELWTLAGKLSEDRLGDVERAMQNYRRGSALGGQTALEALARLHAEQNQALKAAHVLEWLCAASNSTDLAPRALLMAEHYLAAGNAKVARARLEQAAKLAAEPAPLRQRLAELYRAAKKYTPLAELLTQEAALVREEPARLALLKEAARLHVHERGDPDSAVPLLSQAVELDPEDSDLRLSLADALRRASRYDEAIAVLQTQVERYGARRPKKRALVHYRLGLVCIAAGRRADALSELDVANKIDPAHPGVSQALARLAFEEGDLDRAERMYRSLLLVLGHAESDDAPSRATALLDLSEIASKQGDTSRAEEFVESAFEAAIEHAGEAKALEQALKDRGRIDLLARALETRLKEALPAVDTAHAMGNLVELARAGHVGQLNRAAIAARADSVLATLKRDSHQDAATWTQLAKVFDYLGDRDKEALILEQQVMTWTDQGEQPEDAEAHYRLAQQRLRNEETRSQGVELLEQALAIDNDVERADKMLRQALASGTKDARAIRLFERIARLSKNSRSLLEALAMSALLPDTGIKALREGVSLAEQLGEANQKQLILERGAAREEGSLAPPDHAWILMELAEVREAAGDMASAYDLRETAAERLPPDERRALYLAVAQAARASGALARAARILERLRQREPQDREVWEPLLEVYHELDDSERITAMLEDTIPLVDSVADRSRLRLEQASVVLKAGDEDRAIQVLRDALEEDPRHLEAAETLTSLLKRSGRTTELAELLRVQLDAAKDRQKVDSIVAASMQLGHLLETKEHHRDAADVYRAVLDWDHGNRDALRGVVRMAELTGDSYAIADAIEALLRVEDPEPAAELAKKLILLREELGDAEGVQRALELAVHANPLDVEQRNALVERYRRRGDHAQAAALLERALDLSPEDSLLLRQVLAAYRESGELTLALRAIDRLLETTPDAPDLMRQRAELKIELGDLDGASDDLERAYSLDPTEPDGLIRVLEQRLENRLDDRATLLHLADVLCSAGELDRARERLRSYAQTAPGEREVLVKLADLDRQAEDWPAALASLRQLIDIEEGEGLIPLALELARIASAAGSPGDAQAALERALAVAPGHPELTGLLRDMYQAVGAYPELAQLHLADAEHSTDAESRLAALTLAAGYLLDADETDSAIGVLEQARAQSPQDLDVATLLARAYAGQGRRHEALQILEEAANAHRGRRLKGLVGVYLEMANIYQDAEAAPEALQALQKAHEFDLKNPHIAMRLGRSALEQGQDQLALRAFRSVTIMKPSEELSPSDVSRIKAEAHYHLALLAQRQGDLRKAKILCSKALTEQTGHEAATELLAQLSQA